MYSRVYVEITNICNMNCSFCHGHSRVPGKMNADEFAHILSQLKGQTGYIYYHLMGEPLTHPDLPLFMKMAADSGFRSVITTNGTLLEKRGKEILAAPLHKISVSLHSFEDGDESFFEKYLTDVCNFADEASKAGVIVVLRLWNKGFDNGRNKKTVDFLQSRLEGEWAENSKGMRIREKFFLEWGDRFEWPDMKVPLQSKKVFCYGLRDHFGILCDGTVVPCCLDSDGIINLGNIFEYNISDILGSRRAKDIKTGFEQGVAAEEMCRRCPYAQRFANKYI